MGIGWGADLKGLVVLQDLRLGKVEFTEGASSANVMTSLALEKSDNKKENSSQIK
jgi:hypothetical protein